MYHHPLARPVRLLITLAVVLTFVLIAPAERALAQPRVIFQDAFSGNISGWKLVTTSDARLGISNGALTLTTSIKGQATWAMPAVTVPDDVDIQVEAEAVNPDSSGEWILGVLFRGDLRALNGSFYHFGINGLGSWEFRVRPKNATSYTNPIESGKVRNFDPEEPFSLRVSARGNSFTFYLNGQSLGTFQDSTLGSTPTVEKYIGLMSGTYQNADRATVRYRKLVVSQGGVVTPDGDNGGESGGSDGGSSGNVLLRETFARTNPNGWRLGATEGSEVSIQNGALVIEVKQDNLLRWTLPVKTFPANLDVSVDVTTEGTGDNWGTGIGLRARRVGSTLSFYLFEIRGTGEYTFLVQNGGQTQKVVVARTRLRNFDPSAKNTMRIVAQGDRFTLYLNDQRLTTARDSTLEDTPNGNLLLTGGTFSDGAPLRAEFSNLVVNRTGGN